MGKPLLRYRPSPAQEYGIIPDVFVTEESVLALNKFAAKFEERYTEGRRLFLLATAKVLLEAVKGKAPTIAGVGKYADSLEVVIIDGLRDDDAVAVIYKYGKRRRLQQDLEGRRTALLIKPSSNAPPWVRVLARYQPWPSFMVPVVPDAKDAQVIARNITETEGQDLRDRILQNRRKIDFELRENGCDKQVRTDTKFNQAIDVVDDIAYQVLRTEFGYGDGKMRTHWRPALDDMEQELYRLKQAFVRYVVNGDRSGLDLPDYKTISAAEAQDYDRSLQNKLAPLVKSG